MGIVFLETTTTTIVRSGRTASRIHASTGSIGTYYITFNERTVNGDDEKRVLFEEALDVDFVILSRERLEYAVKNNELDILKRGYRVLIDKIGIGAEALPLADDKPVPVILSERDYTNIVNDFWYHAVWAKKKLLRGELWMAKSCIDNYMKGLLFKIVECHAHAINGPDYDTWHGGRFFDEWAGDWIVERLSSCYSYYETGDAERALSSTMDQLALKYGCNPNQKPARIFMQEGELPIEVLNGRPGYINFMDALNGWQLVKELKEATGMPAATSFKHVSPAGAAIGLELNETMKKIYFVDNLPLSPLACAYVRARGADRMSSYGDFIALSDVCDVATARFINREVSDGVIAPGYTDEALAILREKRKGTYNVIQISPGYKPAPIEHKDVFGITFEQGRNEIKLNGDELFANIPTRNKNFPEAAKRDLMIALITLKYTQSNSVCYVKDGQAIGIGAGQQSRIHCTRLAGNKADIWYLRQHPKVLNLPWVEKIRRADRDNTIDVYISEDHDDVLANGVWQQFFTEKPEVLTREEKRAWLDTLKGVSLGSDAFFPFGDNIERAHKSGVDYIAQAGGSVRDDHVIETCDKYGIAMSFTGIRLFHH